jgi:hypothetical protein
MKERCWKVFSRKARKGAKAAKEECFQPNENNQGFNNTGLETGSIQTSV